MKLISDPKFTEDAAICQAASPRQQLCAPVYHPLPSSYPTKPPPPFPDLLSSPSGVFLFS